MKLKNRDATKPDIHILMDKNKAVLRNGFVILTKGTHAGFETVRKDAIKNLYHADNVTFKD